MKKRIIGLFLSTAMSFSGTVPVLAADIVTVPGEVLYQQDFEGSVEDELLAKIGNNAAFDILVDDEFGNKVLKLNGYNAFGYNKFGPEYSDAIVKIDFKQIAASGSNGAYLGLGLRAARQSGGAYFSNMGIYFDSIKYNPETEGYDVSAELLRDRIGIVQTRGAEYNKFDSYDAVSESENGILKKNQIFSSSEAKAYERNFDGKYYRMQTSLIGNNLINSIKTEAGEEIQKVSADITPVSTTGTGFTQLQAHSGVYLVDNIKIMSPVEISEFTVTPENAEIELGDETSFILSGQSIQIQPDVARYVYDPESVNIDFAKGTIAPLKEGVHNIEVYLDDINSDSSISANFTIIGKKAAEDKLEVYVENPNVEYGQATEVKVYYGGTNVTELADFSGDAEYFEGTLIPNKTGLLEITVNYADKRESVPLAVNNPLVSVGEVESEPVFTEDFEADVAELTEIYSNGNSGIQVVDAVNEKDSTQSQALLFNNIQASSSLFGPENLKDYVLEYDFWCPTPKGSSASFVGATMRSNTLNGGYKVGYTPVMKYNPETHMVDPSLASAANNRQITVAYGESNGIDKWYFGGFSGSSLQSSQMVGFWFTQKSVISGNKISTELTRRDNNSKMASYQTEISSLPGDVNSGRTALSTSQNMVYFDNVKIYPIKSYIDIKVKYAESTGRVPYEVVGIDGNGDEGRLTGTITAQTTGAVTADGSSFVAGSGIGYVTVCYTDNFGEVKYKIIRTGSLDTADKSEEFTLMTELALCDESGSELSVLESGKPVYAKANLTRTALGGNGIMLIAAIYDFETGELVAVETSSADAVQRVGEDFEVYLKMVLPDNENGSLYAKVMLFTSELKPITESYFEV